MLAGSPAYADETTLIVGYDENYFPVYFYENNRWKGMDVDIVERLVERVNMVSRDVSMSFPRLYNGLLTGRVHIVTNLAKNDIRSEFMDWIGPVRTTSIALITKEKYMHEQFRGYEDLAQFIQATGKKIVYVNGSSFSPSLDAKLVDPSFRKNIFFVSEQSTAIKMLKADRVLGFFYDAFEARAVIASPERAKNTNFKGLTVHNFRVPDSEGGAFIGLSKKLPNQTRQQLLREFVAMKQAGELKKIADKWDAQHRSPCGSSREAP
ncbi:MAG: transporter substrate-binding domain-containing protein [Kordiimonadaceae bacterium]|nr:transporter substrate-binding domain-containing protein [Kordiimonadaceae bacterium]